MPKPDMRFDAAALFEHMRKLKDGPLNEPRRWSFAFEGEEEPLSDFAQFLYEGLHEFLHVIMQADPLMLRVEYVGLLDEAMVAGLHERFSALAAERGLEYIGVSVFDDLPFDLAIFDAAVSGNFPSWDAED